jgi:hypothetical protein
MKLTVLGDSNCVVQGHDLHVHWLCQLSEHFGDKLLIRNASCNGRTTRQALEVLSYEAFGWNPDVMLVQLGLNDCNCWATEYGQPRVSLGAYTQNLEEIVDKANSRAIRCVLQTSHSARCCDVEPYNMAMRKLAMRRHLLLLDPGAVLCDGVSYLSDAVHLNNMGHDTYFQATKSRWGKLIDEISSHTL